MQQSGENRVDNAAEGGPNGEKGREDAIVGTAVGREGREQVRREVRVDELCSNVSADGVRDRGSTCLEGCPY